MEINHSEDIDREEYAVYSVVIENITVTDIEKAGDYSGCQQVKIIVIGERTSPQTGPGAPGEKDEQGKEPSLYIRKNMPTLTQETWEDYIAKNKKSYPLAKLFNLKTPYIILDEKEAMEIKAIADKSHQGDFMQALGSKYSCNQGIMSLSRVGFNHNQSQAYLYAGNYCGPSLARGYAVFLIKRDGAWVVKQKTMLWVS